MPSSDTYRVDGDYQLGHSWKSERSVEPHNTPRFDYDKPHIPDQNSPLPVFRSGDTTSDKWSASSIAASRPGLETVDTLGTVQDRQTVQAPSYHQPSSRPFLPTMSETNSVDTPWVAGALATEPNGATEVMSAFAVLHSKLQVFLGDQISPIRLASHLAVIAVAAVVLIVSQIELPDWQFSLRDLPKDGIFVVSQNQTTENSLNASGNVSGAAEAFQRAVIPFTNQQQDLSVLTSVQEVIAPAQVSAPSLVPIREQIEMYTVRSGDTVLGIAAQHNLQPETLQWANPELEANPDMLRVGDRLVILPIDGVLHIVQPGDTLSTIAAKYKVTTEAIFSYELNHLSDSSTPISVGQQLVIPGGNKPYIARQVLAYNGPVPDSATRGSGTLVWPTSGSITQPYWNGHRAIDVGAWTGTSITASDSGYVIAARTGWNSGYGTMVMIDHGGGYVTLYAHMNSIFVRQGENVVKGQQIGTVGNTGNSTGPHLHFEVRYQGVSRNPFNFLP